MRRFTAFIRGDKCGITLRIKLNVTAGYFIYQMWSRRTQPVYICERRVVCRCHIQKASHDIALKLWSSPSSRTSHEGDLYRDIAKNSLHRLKKVFVMSLFYTESN